MFLYIAVIILESLLLFLILLFLLLLHKKKKKEASELLSRKKDRIREEELDCVLQNQAYIDNEQNALKQNIPYESHYHEEAAVRYFHNRPHICVNIEVGGVLSNKKYIIDVFDSVTIGSEGNNNIVIDDIEVYGRQLKLVRDGDKLLAGNLDTRLKIELRRGRYATYIEDMPIYIETGDVIIMGQTTMKFMFI